MPISEKTYEQVALEDPDGKWELYCGQLRSKPAMTTRHNRLAWILGHQLQLQLDLDEYEVRVDQARVRRPDLLSFIPDVIVVPTALVRRMEQERPAGLETYSEPLPLVIEVWSLSTGTYDVDTKLPEYQRRGDAEIWRLHPVERTLTAWRKQVDGSYRQEVYRGGVIRPIALPNVSIDLDALFNTR